MVVPTEEEIRTRAFELWQDAGRADGEMDRFWYQAEQELRQLRNDTAPPDVLPG